MEKQPISICWLRRDLRLQDNTALYHALKSGYPVLLVFIFDKIILDQLENKNDRRVAFIHETLVDIQTRARQQQSSMLVLYDAPIKAFEKINSLYEIKEIFINHDYEPYAIRRDQEIKAFAEKHQIVLHSFKDQVIFERAEIMKPDDTAYTVFTPYSKIWKNSLSENEMIFHPSEELLSHLMKSESLDFPSLNDIGFDNIKSNVSKPDIDKDLIAHYSQTRNIPAMKGTSHLGVHLRFGTISPRNLVKIAVENGSSFLNELIWREFFMMILYHFPRVAEHPFHKKYEHIECRNNEEEFKRWCMGETGFPLVDAGMRQLNETGWMHNRIRMVVGSFLTKDLLIDWRWGEAYFAEKLLDYELSSNNGNWQWVAGCGCDAAPYFRIFNPDLQATKFDPDLIYIKRWIKEYKEDYLTPIVDHKEARTRALDAYKKAVQDK